ncbi:MAG: 3-dehydroquinate synthase [Deltaproteobacteria bacterium]|nr:3-dehydroquinate synthase [Deltaproteobacteria bacterium]
MEKIDVNLGTRSYVIRIGSGLLDRVGDDLEAFNLGSRVAVITNSVVRPLYGKQVRNALERAGFQVRTVEISDGETYKTLATAERLYDEFVDFRMDRTSTIVALGGGVIGDLAGFAAATYMRGIHFINIPTTLLAQVDSAIGGKTGVDHPRGKNLIGAFYQPEAVFCDLDVLKTLPRKEQVAGMAEVVKYGVILDADFFSYLESHVMQIREQDDSALFEVVRSSCESKAHVVEEDEREAGLRAILNYGHTLGHAIESLTGYSRYIHGEAVSMGMVAAAKIARGMGLCDARVVERIVNLLQKIGLPVEIPEINADAVLEILSHDKKVSDGRVRFVLPERIGKVVIRDDVPPDLIRSVLNG